jgi:hypothetical protein
MANWLKTSSATVPMSWPPLGDSDPATIGRWTGKEGAAAGMADFTSQYLTTDRVRHTYQWTGGVQEYVNSARRKVYDRQPYVDLERPQIWLDSMSSFAYKKQTPGGMFYTPPADILDVPGVMPDVVTAQMMASAAVGAAGIRMYHVEYPSLVASRATAAVGTWLQTGANPVNTDVVGTANWKAMGYAANLLTKVLQPYVLGTALSSPAYGRNIVTAVRQGSDARMLLLVNANDWERTITVDLTPYRTGQAITRYTVSGDGLRTDELADGPADTIQLRGGESVVYLFPLTGGIAFTQKVPLTFPAGQKVVVRYNYIYPELDQAGGVVDCGSGCTLTIDRRLGDFYYQTFSLDANKNILSRSSVQVLR